MEQWFVIGLLEWKKMQYIYVHAFPLNNKYLLFLVSDETLIDIFILLARHRRKNAPPHIPLSFLGWFVDVDT